MMMMLLLMLRMLAAVAVVVRDMYVMMGVALMVVVMMMGRYRRLPQVVMVMACPMVTSMAIATLVEVMHATMLQLMVDQMAGVVGV